MNTPHRPATLEQLTRVGDQLEWDPSERRGAAELLFAGPDPADWTRYLRRFAIGLGTGLALSGFFDLVAWNWSELGRFTRLGIVASVFIAVAIAALRTPGWKGAIAATAAAVLAGAVLAVIGQTWQTGADSWLLFFWWSVCALPFALGARYAPLWVLWATLASVTSVMWWHQTFPGLPVPGLVLTCGVMASAFIAVAIRAEKDGTEEWVRRTWIAAAGAFAGIGVLGSGFAEEQLFAVMVAPIALMAVAAVYTRFGQDRRDAYAVAVALFVGILALTVAPVRMIFETGARVDEGWPLIGLGCVVLVESGVALALVTDVLRRNRLQEVAA